MKVKFKIDLTKSQQDAYNLLKKKDVKYLVLRFSRQSGKSIFAEIALISKLLEPCSTNFYISPTFAQGRKVYREIKNLLEPTGLIKSSNSSTLTIELKNRSQLLFFSTENPTSIRGNTLKGTMVLDEVAFMNEQTTDGGDLWSSVIYPTIKRYRKTKNKVIFISTPKGKRGLFWRFHKNCVNKVKGWFELVSTIFDDSLITKEEIDEIKEQIPEQAFREEFMVEFLDGSRSFFTGFEECFTKFSFDTKCKCWGGLDFSANGKDETIYTLVNEKNQFKFYVIKGSLDEKYSQIADLINTTPNLEYVYAEENSVGEVMLNEIIKLVKVKQCIKKQLTTNASKIEMLSLLAVAIAKKEPKFEESDNQTFAQFENFGTKYTKKGTLQLEALTGHDDRIISGGFAWKAKNDASVMGAYNLSFLNRR